MFFDYALKILFYLLPMYVANSSAMLVGGKTPVDLNTKLADGERLLGKGKTFKGTIGGILIGTIAGAILFHLFPMQTALVSNQYLELSFLLAAGAILGDIGGSFLKRRNQIPAGEEVLLLDQLDFVIGGMITGSLIYAPSFHEAIIVCIATIIAHKASNYAAYKLKLKKVPW